MNWTGRLKLHDEHCTGATAMQKDEQHDEFGLLPVGFSPR